MIENAFKAACFAEIEAIKPGNVHIFADGHGMKVQDFLNSADATAPIMALPELTIGERILHSMQATLKVAGCNTNLGIVLLCAPIAQAFLNCQQNKQSFKFAIKKVLINTTIQDANNCFKAIKLANPAGLGKLEKHDANDSSDITLLKAMKLAAPRDHVALQYANEYADIVGFGLTCYRHALVKWDKQGWAVPLLYLSWLAKWPDTHIVRKLGLDIAKEVQDEAIRHLHNFSDLENPKTYLGELLRWDADLKNRGINPGTSADLTVSTLFLYNLSY